MKCWVCSRQARGFGHADHRHAIADPRRYPIDWAFCSRRCQDVFHLMYGHWKQVKEGPIDSEEIAMIDPTKIELAAMRKCLGAFGEAGEAIGFYTPLGEYSEAEALQVIEAIVTCYTSALTEYHEASKVPPVHGMPATPDPMKSPLADLKDDLPWESKP